MKPRFGVVLEALLTGGLSLITNDGITLNSVAANDRNYCLCCGSRSEYYGTCSLDSTGIRRICDKEVCVLCLEGGCSNCNGQKLAQPAGEWHEGCGHDEAGK